MGGRAGNLDIKQGHEIFSLKGYLIFKKSVANI